MHVEWLNSFIKLEKVLTAIEFRLITVCGFHCWAQFVLLSHMTCLLRAFLLLIPWLKEPHSHCGNALYAAKLCSSSHNWFPHNHNIGLHRDPRLQRSSVVQGALHLRTLHFKERERQELGKHAFLISHPPKKQVRLKTSHFQSPKSLVLPWHPATFHALVVSLLVLEKLYSVGGRKDSLHPP